MMADTLTAEEVTMPCARGCCATQREHYQSIVFGAAPAESDKFKGGYTKQFDADMDAYRQLRKDGVQPEKVDGSASLLRDVNDGKPPPSQVEVIA